MAGRAARAALLRLLAAACQSRLQAPPHPAIVGASMDVIPPDRSRDARIEDPSNRWIVHPASHALLPLAVRAGISANAVSVMGLALGLVSAWAYWRWADPLYATLGFVVMFGWLIADGLDGMIARATDTASALGRALDGICDHGVFIIVYVTIATRIGTGEGWALAIVAGAAHIWQSNFYESERARFHRRVRGDAGAAQAGARGNPLVSAYDRLARTIDGSSAALDDALRYSTEPAALGADYGAAAARPLRFQALLSANTRVIAIWLACLWGNPRLFWWFEIGPLSAITIMGILWHRKSVINLLIGAPSPYRAGA